MRDGGRPGVHLAAFYSSSLADESGLVALSAVADSVMARSGTTGLVPSRDMEIAAAYAGGGLAAGGAGLKRARISAPTLAQVISPAIRPIAGTASTSAAPPSDAPLMVMTDHPLPLPAGEAVTVVAESSVDLTIVNTLLFLRERFEPAPPGPMYILRGANPASGATTPVQYTWTPIAIDWDQPLPAGRYAIVWIQYVAAGTSTNLPMAARLVLADQVLRPGTIAQGTVADLPNRQLQDGVLGVLGTFESFAMPTVEVLNFGSTPLTTAEISLGLIRLTDAQGRPCKCS